MKWTLSKIGTYTVGGLLGMTLGFMAGVTILGFIGFFVLVMTGTNLPPHWLGRLMVLGSSTIGTIAGAIIFHKKEGD